MPLSSVLDPAVAAALEAARTKKLTPSPEDWRDLSIYFLLLDRFNNPHHAPRHAPWDGEYSGFQGGTFEGVRAKLPYLKELGVGALWLSPVLKTPAWDPHAYHGYGIQNFLEVEPRLASDPDHADAELKALVDDAHAQGIYVIFDIVLHHAADVFAYRVDGKEQAQLDWQEQVQEVRWRGADGQPRAEWADGPHDPGPDDALWPQELQRTDLFTRRGDAQSGEHGFHAPGDFSSLKGFDADFQADDGTRPVWDTLIRAHQYLIAKYDVDGFRIDTLKFLSPAFARAFAEGVRAFAKEAGKDRFFTFGEVWDTDEVIAPFIGTAPSEGSDQPGLSLDAAVDYPLFFQMPKLAQGTDDATPDALAELFLHRAALLKGVQTSLGSPAGSEFVTFLDNHDQDTRFGHFAGRHRAARVTLGLGLLYTLQGIPCLYYGTEQGLTGHKTKTRPDDSNVREALWGRPRAFARAPLYKTIAALNALRRDLPALCRGEQFFRAVSGDSHSFSVSPHPRGVVAFSRLLDGVEVLIVANCADTAFTGEVLVDCALHDAGAEWAVQWSSAPSPAAPSPMRGYAAGSVEICEVDGTVTTGPARTLPVTLKARELQVITAS